MNARTSIAHSSAARGAISASRDYHPASNVRALDVTGDLPGSLQLNPAKERLSSGWVVHALLVLAITAGGFLAHAHARPITAALAFLFAVVLVATRGGLKIGLAASIAASLAYNLFLSDPVLRFSFDTVDDLMPLFAFNISAITSAYVAGRLRDEARTIEHSADRARSLLTFSQALQTGVDLEAMLLLAQRSAPELSVIEIHLDDGRLFSSAAKPCLVLTARRFADGETEPFPSGDGHLALAERFEGGMVVALADRDRTTEAAARLAIFAIAAERWTLTERLAEADFIRRAEEFKTNLLSSVSHDVRTPLAVISASAGSLLRHRSSLSEESQRDLLETIEQQSSRLNRLTSKLLSLSRIEGGLVFDDMPEVDALEVLGSALVTVRQLAPDKSISKELTLDAAPVRADPSLLEQVLYNVLENAVVHTPQDTPIHVSVVGENGSVIIRVDDLGPGLGREQSAHVFERFYQGGSEARAKAGSGLGLAIARGFARAIHGDVTVQRRPDGQQGSRFEIVVPLLGDRHDAE